MSSWMSGIKFFLNHRENYPLSILVMIALHLKLAFVLQPFFFTHWFSPLKQPATTTITHSHGLLSLAAMRRSIPLSSCPKSPSIYQFQNIFREFLVSPKIVFMPFQKAASTASAVKTYLPESCSSKAASPFAKPFALIDSFLPSKFGCSNVQIVEVWILTIASSFSNFPSEWITAMATHNCLFFFISCCNKKEFIISMVKFKFLAYRL